MKKFTGVLIASDVDGTLLNSSHEVSQENRQALDYFMSEGGFFTVATGRTRQTYAIVQQDITINAPAILCNGALLYDFKKKLLLHTQGLPGGAFNHALVADILKRFPEVTCECYTLDDLYLTKIFEVSQVHMDYACLNYHDYMPENMPEDWLKILVTSIDTALLHTIRDYINSTYPALTAFMSTRYFLEILSKGVNKGEGVLRLANHLGVAMNNVYTVGDEENDVEMIQVAACGFATANAVDSVKNAANYILPHNDQNAIAALVCQLDKRYHAAEMLTEQLI